MITSTKVFRFTARMLLIIFKESFPSVIQLYAIVDGLMYCREIKQSRVNQNSLQRSTLVRHFCKILTMTCCLMMNLLIISQFVMMIHGLKLKWLMEKMRMKTRQFFILLMSCDITLQRLQYQEHAIKGSYYFLKWLPLFLYYPTAMQVWNDYSVF